MNSEILKNFLLSSSDYCFRVGPYVVPKFIVGSKGSIVNLEENWENGLIENESMWSRYFETILNCCYNKVLYQKEVPLIIEKSKIMKWKNLCGCNRVTDFDSIMRSYFLADFVFPEYNLIVEIDSDLHNQNYDKARDEYIKDEWGFEILRFPGFGSSPENVGYYLRQFNKQISIPSRNYINLYYGNAALDYFNRKNSDIIYILNTIEKKILSDSINGDTVFIKESSIRSEEELERIKLIIFNVYGLKVDILKGR